MKNLFIKFVFVIYLSHIYLTFNKKTMKKLMILILTATSLQIHSNPPEPNYYCLGFETGYKDGYCLLNRPCEIKKIPSCIKPLNGKNSYADGYDLGYKKGTN